MTDRHHAKLAIIDIGSNSVRMVVYDGIKRTPSELFNEKVLCALGEGLAATGRLNPQGVIRALAALQRFAMLTDIMQVQQVALIGTAALRDADDGQAFIEQVQRKTGFHIRLVEGNEEAELAAQGAYNSLQQGEGLACDLGGGSLELVHIHGDGSFGRRCSLPLGVLRVMNESANERGRAREWIKEWLETQKPLRKQARGCQLYLVGGSFRSLARLHMDETHYPLKLLHAYEADAMQMRRFASRISKTPEEMLPDVPEVTGKRLRTLPMAALILQQLIKYFEPERVMFSSCGVREGVLYRLLSLEEQGAEPLHAAANDMLNKNEGNQEFGEALLEWLQPVLQPDHPNDQRLLAAACLLMTLPFPDVSVFRAEAAFMRIMHAPIMGISHRERALLAVTVFHRFRFENDYPMSRLEALGSTREDCAYGFFLGTMGALAYAISGGSRKVLECTRPQLGKNRLLIESSEPELLATDAVQKRLYRANLAYVRLQEEQKRKRGRLLLTLG